MKKVRDIMIPDITAVSRNTTLRVAVKIMAHSRFTGIPVVDDEQKVIGFVSEKDIIMSFFPNQRESDALFVRDFAYLASQVGQVDERQVKDIMTREAMTVTEDDDISYLAELMILKDLKIVPVVKKDRLVGIASRIELCQILIAEETTMIEK